MTPEKDPVTESQPTVRPVSVATPPDQAATTDATSSARPEPLKPVVAQGMPAMDDSFIMRTEQDEPRSGLRDALSVLVVLGSAVVMAFGLITYVFQSYQVDGQSMRATLENQDHLIIWKADKTMAWLQGKHYMPHRGDIVIFDEPVGFDGSYPTDKQLIKRVLALPGERIVMKGKDVTVFNKEHPEGFNPDKTMPYGGQIVNVNGQSDDDHVVGANQVFVAGDNRDNSTDSRLFGPIDTDLIIGKLGARILPVNDFKLF